MSLDNLLQNINRASLLHSLVTVASRDASIQEDEPSSSFDFTDPAVAQSGSLQGERDEVGRHGGQVWGQPPYYQGATSSDMSQNSKHDNMLRDKFGDGPKMSIELHPCWPPSPAAASAAPGTSLFYPA